MMTKSSILVGMSHTPFSLLHDYEVMQSIVNIVQGFQGSHQFCKQNAYLFTL